MKPLLPGTDYKWSVHPKPEDTAAAIGNPGVDVISTPATIGYLEMTCFHLMEPCFEDGEVSVGTSVTVRHKAAAFPDSGVECSARFLNQEGRQLRFSVEARQAGKLIMDGHHERAVVKLDRFLAAKQKPGATVIERTPATSAHQENQVLKFWYDIQSPWSYLTANQISRLAERHGKTVEWLPFQLPRVVKAIKGRRPLEESASFVAWYHADLQDWARMEGLNVQFHPDYPLRNARAMRVCLYAKDEGVVEKFSLALYHAYWSEAADISDQAILGQIAQKVGLNPDAAMEAAVSRDFKARLEANTQVAIDRGVFGAPTIDFDNRLFFGNDRLPMLERHISRMS